MKNLLVAVVLMSGCATHRESESVENRPSDTPYTFPLTSPGTKFGTLPPAVQNAVRAEAGSAEITDIVKLYRDGTPIYEIQFRNRDLFPPLYAGADGSVLHHDLTVAMGAPQDSFGIIRGSGGSGIRLSELPPPVMKVLQERVPGAAIAHINKETWGDRAVYIFAFTDEVHHPRLYLAADGTVLNEGPK